MEYLIYLTVPQYNFLSPRNKTAPWYEDRPVAPTMQSTCVCGLRLILLVDHRRLRWTTNDGNYCLLQGHGGIDRLI